ncbi:DUF4176 domain-containing protein [Salipaludibacillus agaradhaerens]|jgi:hypothetical protein|uniref:DUF4176 domain-containing protein n=1 Tax=Salipaludibacillus agaradhaerens TaxID=76935 RepID=UPI0021510F55|nr:DUF4176 domain-containing protein [Salipaludibacillus agaradhaerens]MCR6105705.1 DUF4176 domain-containing protein [Salipaludibacillus agaradhaerens]MCR6117741.1 DUF4176 domain-containing protein [Salipaludibacillus agaradhaerens]
MLPMGSIVYLKQGTSKLMILNRGPIIEVEGEQTWFDYSACFYPQGLVPDQVLYFNHENVDEVVFEGFKDTEEDRFQTLYQKWQEENGQTIKRGKVTEPLK